METTVVTTTSVDEEPPTGPGDSACPTGLAFGDWAEPKPEFKVSQKSGGPK